MMKQLVLAHPNASSVCFDCQRKWKNMMINKLCVFLCFIFLCRFCAAATNYVVPAATPGVSPEHPFTNGWSKAATNIQDAINAADDYNTVLVSTGVYMLTNEIVVRKAITIRSWNNGISDRNNTILHGNNYAGKSVTNRCVYIDHVEAVVQGFTITNGAALGPAANRRITSDQRRGGGVFIEAGGTLDDCLVVSNTAYSSGGGVFMLGGLVTGCEITGNSPALGQSGGGVYVHNRGTVSNSTMIGNKSTWSGAGLCLAYNAVVIDCNIISNELSTINRFGSGVAFSYGSNVVVERCNIFGNKSLHRHGGGVSFDYFADGVLRNCLVWGNTAATNGGGIYFYRSTGTVENCTIVSNAAFAATGVGGGIHLVQTVAGCAFNLCNSIVYGNIAGGLDKENISFDLTAGAASISNSCVSPVPEHALLTVSRTTAANPMFEDSSAGNFRLRPGSPCVNTGLYLGKWMAGARDMDGVTRVDRYSGLVDMGCYEYLHQGIMCVFY